MPRKPDVVVLTPNGYVTIRGRPHDVVAFLRVSDGEIDYEVYAHGKAPPSGSDEEVGERHMDAAETIALDGGMWEANTAEDLLGFQDEVLEETGKRITFAVATPMGEG
jgi:hypothetical protein